jgi:dolichyl-diphosphooligosaccharide--protein glycosyltransferase
MKENTPEPFGDPGFYYEYLSPEQVAGPKNFVYPDSAYGVLAWWDYGYWITRIAHRVPVANPSQDPVRTANVARYFISQDESAANEILADIRGLKRSDSVDGNVPYVIIDYQTAITKFHTIATWSGQGTEKIYDFYLVPQNGGFISVPLFYPAYYRSLSTRLYIFDGDEVIPTISWVISYGEKVINGGEPQKYLTGVEQFDTYQEAEAYLLSQSSDNYRIVSVSPFLTPVPLEAVQNYRLVHSAGTVMHPDVGVFTEVKIFEYTE